MKYRGPWDPRSLPRPRQGSMLYVGLMTRADREHSVRSRCICALAMQARRRSTWLCRSTVCRVRAYGHTPEVRWVSPETDLDSPVLREIMVNWAVIRSKMGGCVQRCRRMSLQYKVWYSSQGAVLFAEFQLAVFPFEVTKNCLSDREDPSAMLELWTSHLRRNNSRERRSMAVFDSVTRAHDARQHNAGPQAIPCMCLICTASHGQYCYPVRVDVTRAARLS